MLGKYQLRPMPSMKAAQVQPLDRKADLNNFPGVFDNDKLAYEKVSIQLTLPISTTTSPTSLTYAHRGLWIPT
jgi:hypothetical protein